MKDSTQYRPNSNTRLPTDRTVMVEAVFETETVLYAFLENSEGRARTYTMFSYTIIMDCSTLIVSMSICLCTHNGPTQKDNN